MSANDVEAVFEASLTKPVLVFKHSPRCSISIAVLHSLQSELEALSLAMEIQLVDVVQSRQVSNLIAEETGVRHESPQAIVLRNGDVVYSASHFSVRVKELLSAAETQI